MTQQDVQAYIPLLAPLATLAVVIVGFIYNNSRLTDLRDLLRAEFNGHIGTLRAEMRTERAEMRTERAEDRAQRAEDRAESNARFTRLETKLDGQLDAIMRLLADIDARVTRLEERG